MARTNAVAGRLKPCAYTVAPHPSRQTGWWQS
jgi:hypothetical protein